MGFRSEYRVGLSAAGAVEAGEGVRVVLFLMSDSIARRAVGGETGPKHPDSGFRMPRSTTQRPAELVQEAEEHLLPRIPPQQPVHDAVDGRNWTA